MEPSYLIGALLMTQALYYIICLPTFKSFDAFFVGFDHNWYYCITNDMNILN